MTISERIFDEMKTKNLKSSDLAFLLGVSKSVISSWKTRNANPPSEYIVQICVFLSVSLEYLLTGDEKKSPQSDLTESEREVLKLVQPLSNKDKIKVIGIIENYLGNRSSDIPNIQPMYIKEEQADKLFKNSTKKPL